MCQNAALCGNGLTLLLTNLTFNNLEKTDFLNIKGKRKITGYMHFLLFQ